MLWLRSISFYPLLLFSQFRFLHLLFLWKYFHLTSKNRKPYLIHNQIRLLSNLNQLPPLQLLGQLLHHTLLKLNLLIDVSIRSQRSQQRQLPLHLPQRLLNRLRLLPWLISLPLSNLLLSIMLLQLLMIPLNILNILNRIRHLLSLQRDLIQILQLSVQLLHMLLNITRARRRDIQPNIKRPALLLLKTLTQLPPNILYHRTRSPEIPIIPVLILHILNLITIISKL